VITFPEGAFPEGVTVDYCPKCGTKQDDDRDPIAHDGM